MCNCADYDGHGIHTSATSTHAVPGATPYCYSSLAITARKSSNYFEWAKWPLPVFRTMAFYSKKRLFFSNMNLDQFKFMK